MLASKLLNYLAIGTVVDEAIVLLGSAIGQGLEPVGVVNGTVVNGPCFHASGYAIGKEAEGAEKAKVVTDSEEMASQVFVEDIVSEQGMSKKELKAKREADREMMKEILNEDKE